jgi:hypothetical protein
VSAPGIDVDLRDSEAIFHRNEALFLADIDGEIRPILRPGKEYSSIYDTFNRFYSWGATYDMVKQWTVNDGQFEYDYTWLSPAKSSLEVKQWAERQFNSAFGVDTAAFRCIARQIP